MANLKKRKAADSVSDPRYPRGWKPLRAALSVLVAAGTLGSLMLPAITMNQECTLQEHLHNEECQLRLACTYDTMDIHSHGESCYDESQRLICGQADFVIHSHDGLCYDQAGELVCTLPVVEEHIHGEECYEYPVVEPGHTHGDGCYVCTYGEAVVCTLPEDETHTHGEECHEKIRGEFVCGEEEREPVLAEEPVLICEKPVIIAHLHEELCYAPEESTEATEAATEATEAATEATEAATEATEAATEPTEAATEPVGETVPERELICAYLEVPVHQHTEACIQPAACQMEEHVHVNDCFPGQEPEQEDPAGWETLLTSQWSIDLETIALNQLGYAESTSNRICAEDGQIRGYTRYGHWAGTPHAPWQTLFLSFCLAYADIPEEAIPRGQELQPWLTALAEKSLLSQEGEPQTGDLVFLDRDGDGNADTGAILVCQLDETGAEQLYTLEGDYENAVGCLPYDAAAVVKYVSLEQAYVAYLQGEPEGAIFTRVCQGSDYTVTASFGPEAGFPEDVTMSVRELDPDSQEYLDYYNQIPQEKLDAQLYSLRLFDITFHDAQGSEVEPAAPVDIRILYDQAVAPTGTDCTVIHFDEEKGPEAVDVTPVEAQDGGITGMEFRQDSFSVSAVLVTAEKSTGNTSTYAGTTTVKSPASSVFMSREDTDTYRRTTDYVTLNDWQTSFINDDNNINTSRAGGVFMDKSVTASYVEYDNGKGDIGRVEADSGKFLVGLSTIGSTQAVAGVESAPTDVMFVLDMSSSMYTVDGSSSARDPSTVKLMVEALNESIAQLNSLNENNRIGIVLYWGYHTVTEQSGPEHSEILLPLDRYSSQSGEFLVVDLDADEKLNGVYVNSDVYNSSGDAVVDPADTDKTYHSIATGEGNSLYVAGTYAQAGIMNAWSEFMRKDISPKLADDTPRTPVYVFMTDGKPTAGSVNFSTAHKEVADMGNNRETARAAAETDFVTQLTAAYAKTDVNNKYYVEGASNEALFYSLGLGQNDKLALDVLDAGNVNVVGNSCNLKDDGRADEEIEISKTIAGYWYSLVQYDTVSFEVWNWPDWTWVEETLTVTPKNLTNGTSFPSNINQQKYVNKYFNAGTRDNLKEAFNQIMLEISYQQSYSVTYTEPDQLDNSGFVTFIDTIGDYMTVTDMEGIILNGELHSGLALARNFWDKDDPKPVFPEGTELGTMAGGSSLGVEFCKAVGVDMGFDPQFEGAGTGNADYWKTIYLIDAAYNVGQLSYKSETEYTNYIEWYAKADPVTGEHIFLGLAHEPGANCNNGRDDLYTCESAGHCTTPPAGATHLVRSYYHLGPVTPEDDGSLTYTNMMYSVTWHRTDLATGQESIIFALPSSLLPTVDYRIDLNMDKTLRDVSVTGASSPAVLLYQVAVREDVSVEQLVEEGTYYGIEYAVDDNGNPVYQHKRDEKGRLVYEQQTDAEGNPVYDADGNPVYVQETDAEGNPLFDADGKPVYKPVYERVVSHVYFYSNDFDLTTEYSLTNTHAYFRPNERNDRYYYTGPITEKENSPTPIYTQDANGNYVQVSGDRPLPEAGNPDKYLEKFVYYTKIDGVLETHVQWKPFSHHSIALEDGHDHLEKIGDYWYVKAGTAHDMQTSTIDSNYYFLKMDYSGNVDNRTGTVAFSEVPFTDTAERTSGNYIIGTMQGNNGRLMVDPFYFSGKKTLTGVNLAEHSQFVFEFELHKVSTKDAELSAATLIQTVTNSGTGRNEIVFDAVWPAMPGLYYYVVRELPADGIISDGTEYLITISVGNRETTRITEVIKRGSGEPLYTYENGQEVLMSFEGLNFTNSVGYELPETGGAGLLPYFFSGTRLLGVAALLDSNKRKKSRTEGREASPHD